MGLRPLKKKVMETIGRYVNENKIPIPFRGVPGVEASRKKSIDPFIISAILLATSHAE
jgi:hypothetical protein